MKNLERVFELACAALLAGFAMWAVAHGDWLSWSVTMLGSLCCLIAGSRK